MRLHKFLSAAQRLVPRADVGDVVLAYHLVGAGTDSVVDVPVAQFREQLDRLAQTFEFAGLSQVLTSGAGSRPRVVLTFDDAFANFAQVIWPILLDRKLPAVLYAPVGFVSGRSPSPLRGAKLAACSFAQLRTLAAGGVEVGSHGVTHVNLRRTSDAVLDEELLRSRSELEQELGQSVPSFCYPQGKLDGRVLTATARHYRSAVAGGGRRYLGHSPHRIPRFPVRRNENNFDAMISSKIWLRETLADGVRQWRR